MIAVDWGTTNLRAYRLSSTGVITDRRFSSMGLLHVPSGRFADVLRNEVTPWLDEGETTLMLCGMVGSRRGWAEAGYVPCPASWHDFAKSLLEVPFEGARVRIVPGATTTTDYGVPEIMRGEETAIFGALQKLDLTHTICLPGTHSKWASVAGGRLESFQTFMTGEVFAALSQHTILAQCIHADAPHDPSAFQRGVEHSAHPGGLLHHLFHVRTLPIMGMLQTEASASFLSGLLIGSEVHAMLPQTTPVLLLGSKALCCLYAEAIALCGGLSITGSEDAAAHGLFQLATFNDGPEVHA